MPIDVIVAKEKETAPIAHLWKLKRWPKEQGVVGNFY